MIKRSLLIVVVLTLFVFPTVEAKAWYGCGSYVTVQWGDTLSGLAAQCGTSVEAIRAANPGLGWWLFAGQIIYLPSGYTSTPVYQYPSASTYTVQAGDTLAIVAARYGISVYDLWAANPQIWDPSLIYVGQVINIPAAYGYPAPPPPPPPVVYPTPNPYPYPPVNPSGNTLKVTYKKGLFVRNGPDGKIIGWATYDEYKDWCYYPNTITKDANGKVWVQVDLSPSQGGYSTGWILIKDQYGNYFTTLTPGW